MKIKSGTQARVPTKGPNLGSKPRIKTLDQNLGLKLESYI